MITAVGQQKANGAYYTPEPVARTLVRWVVRHEGDRLLDPSCGDGRFLEHHANSVGVEFDPAAAVAATRRGLHRTIHVEDFFAWAERTSARFDCAAGNPPFIRYQRFSGDLRRRARQLCLREGIQLSGLSSSWLPFIVVTTNLLKPGGRLAFVVPAEIGHSTYAAKLLSFLARRFGDVRVVAIQESVFPDLSQDAWLLYAADKGATTDSISFAALTQFASSVRPPRGVSIPLTELRAWRHRLRPFLLTDEQRVLYRRLSRDLHSAALGELARVGIGYVTGANEFFHLRPSQAARLGIPDQFLLPTVRNGRSLRTGRVTSATIDGWRKRDEPYLLLALSRQQSLPATVRRYLDSAAGQEARQAYKCRNRSPWYVVPDVLIPDAFLTYMSGEGPSLVANEAHCTCTNSIHAVRLLQKLDVADFVMRWQHPLTRLSCELEGHPLGGGMLKLEPREAARVRVAHGLLRLSRRDNELIEESITALRNWRHYA
jgi:hypothetical protein